MTTPLGSAVAPEVKMISAISSRVTITAAAARRRVHVELVQLPDRRGDAARERRHVLADQHELAATMPATRARKSGDAR